MRGGWARLATLIAAGVAWSAQGRADVPALGVVEAQRLVVHDTAGPLPVSPDGSPTGQALAKLLYEPTNFEVEVQPAPPVDRAMGGPDAYVRFSSPVNTGDAQLDRVTARWHRAKGVDLSKPTPMVVLAHSLQPQLFVGSAMARGLADRGVHVLLVELPGFASRQPQGVRFPVTATFGRIPQAAADLRRARDVAAALPGIDPGRVGLAGVSLGGLFATLAGGYDGAFARIELVCTGADVNRVLAEGRKDADFAGRALRSAGWTEAQIQAATTEMDPTRLAPRLDPGRTRVFAAADDQVFSTERVAALTGAAGLPEGAVVWIAGNHYTMARAMPAVLDAIAAGAREAEPVTPSPAPR
ncbi:MAG: hypothetical protein AAGA57_07780 [Planctomycetota bacterium]